MTTLLEQLIELKPEFEDMLDSHREETLQEQTKRLKRENYLLKRNMLISQIEQLDYNYNNSK